jgi:hypothetical protein
MWPFNNRTRIPDRLPIEGPWTVGQGENDGKVMIVRFNSGYKGFAPIPSYEYQAGIAVPLLAPESNGLPSSGENAELGGIEDTICASLEQEAQSLFVASITTCGMKEFVFYTRAPENVKQRFQNLQRSITTHDIQLMIQPDKNWEVYETITPGAARA